MKSVAWVEKKSPSPSLQQSNDKIVRADGARWPMQTGDRPNHDRNPLPAPLVHDTKSLPSQPFQDGNCRQMPAGKSLSHDTKSLPSLRSKAFSGGDAKLLPTGKSVKHNAKFSQPLVPSEDCDAGSPLPAKKPRSSDVDMFHALQSPAILLPRPTDNKNMIPFENRTDSSMDLLVTSEDSMHNGTNAALPHAECNIIIENHSGHSSIGTMMTSSQCRMRSCPNEQSSKSETQEICQLQDDKNSPNCLIVGCVSGSEENHLVSATMPTSNEDESRSSPDVAGQTSDAIAEESCMPPCSKKPRLLADITYNIPSSHLVLRPSRDVCLAVVVSPSVVEEPKLDQVDKVSSSNPEVMEESVDSFQSLETAAQVIHISSCYIYK